MTPTRLTTVLGTSTLLIATHLLGVTSARADDSPSVPPAPKPPPPPP
ncbi:OmpA-like domain-containing protein OS=Streptomyces fumanus OX=67302 GN=GCM10018772_41520 PE=4 SV=1 [Streptomyces fumanus]